MTRLRPRWRAIGVAALAALWLVAHALAAGAAPEDRHGRLYRAGRLAHLAGNHRNAVLLLLDAIAARATEGEPWVRLYGRHRAPYLPHFYLGASLFELGEYDRARTAFDESERQGAVLESEEAAALADYRRRLIEDAVPALRAETAAELEQLRSLIVRLDHALAATPGATEPAIARGRATAALEAAEALTSGTAAPATAEIPQWRRATAQLSEAAGEVSRAILAAESEREIVALRRLLEVRIEGCDPTRIDQLSARLEMPIAEPELAARVRLLHARLRLACGEPGPARLELDRVRADIAATAAARPASAPLWAEVERLAADAARLELEQRWQRLRVHDPEAPCDASAIEELELFAAALEPGRGASAAIQPHLVLARTLLECGEPERAAESFEVAESRAEGDPTERRAVGERIRAAAADRQALREKLLAEIEAGLARERDRPCAPEELDQLDRLLAELTAAAPADRAGDASSALRVRTFLYCHELTRAESALADGLRDGGIEGAALETLTRELAAARRRRDLELERRQLLEDFVAANAAADLGVCDAARLERLDRLFGGSSRSGLAAWVRRTAGLAREPELVLLAGYRACGDVAAIRRNLSRAESGPAAGRSAEVREARRWLVEREVGAIYAGRHALLVGAAEYAGSRGGWWNLDGVRTDVDELSRFLRSIGFDSVEVVAPPVTGARVREAVTGFVARHGAPGDAGDENLLLFYFAGHGETLASRLAAPAGGYEFKSGYFVPEDAPRPGEDPATRERFLELAIGMDEVERWARSIRTKHALFLFDTCFSGTVFRAVSRGRGLVVTRDEGIEPGRLPPLVVARAASPVRLFATAGTENQVVPDESVFRRLLLEALSGRRSDADYTRDGFLLGREICLFLEDQVAVETASRQTPQCGTMPPPFNEGDIVFRLPEPGSDTVGSGEALARLRAEIEDWNRSRLRSNGLAEYLADHPSGHFAGLARYLALQGETSLADRGAGAQPGS